MQSRQIKINLNKIKTQVLQVLVHLRFPFVNTNLKRTKSKNKCTNSHLVHIKEVDCCV